MPTKEKLEQELNNTLGTEMEWSRLLADDLELFHELVHEGMLIEPMVKVQIKDKGKAAVEKEIDEWTPGKYLARVL